MEILYNTDKAQKTFCSKVANSTDVVLVATRATYCEHGMQPLLVTVKQHCCDSVCCVVLCCVVLCVCMSVMSWLLSVCFALFLCASIPVFLIVKLEGTTFRVLTFLRCEKRWLQNRTRESWVEFCRKSYRFRASHDPTLHHPTDPPVHPNPG